MKQNINILSAGGDRRFVILSRRLGARNGTRVMTYGQGRPDPVAGSIFPHRLERISELKQSPDILILPLPLTLDGESLAMPLEKGEGAAPPVSLNHLLDLCHPHTRVYCGLTPVAEGFKQLCRGRGLRLIDYMEDEAFTLRNADATAEAAVSLAVTLLPVTIRGTRVLITGGGRIARSLTRILAAMGAEVTLAARSAAARTQAELLGAKAVPLTALVTVLPTIRLLINTIPVPIFGREEVGRIPENALIIELASSPGGFEPEALEEYRRPLVKALSLPGKTAPESCAAWLEELIAENEKGFA